MIPHQNNIGLPALVLLSNGKKYHINEIEKKLAHHFALNKDERNFEKLSGGESLFHNRIRWAIFYLRKAGLIESPKPGYSIITEEGQKLIKKNPRIVDAKYLKQIPKFAEWISKPKKPNFDFKRY